MNTTMIVNVMQFYMRCRGTRESIILYRPYEMNEATMNKMFLSFNRKRESERGALSSDRGLCNICVLCSTYKQLIKLCPLKNTVFGK